MVLNKYRGTVNKILIPIARVFSGLHPNTISAVSLLFALLAGIAFMYGDQSRIEDDLKPGHYFYIMLAIASICVFLNGFLDAVDGFVARMTKRTSKRGDLFDHAVDRYADIFILGGIMLSPYCDTVLGALALVAVLMTSYMGTQAQALGCGRNYSGLLGRADRLVILIFAPIFQMVLSYYDSSGRLPIPGMFEFTILEWTMIWFFIAGNVTAIHRGILSWRELRTMEEPQKTLDQYFDMIGPTKVEANPTRSIHPTQTRFEAKPRKTPYKPPVSPKPPRGTRVKLDIDWDDTESKPKSRSTTKLKPSPAPRPQRRIRSPVRTNQKPKDESKRDSKPIERTKPKLKQQPKPEPKPEPKEKPKHKPRTKLKLKQKPKQSSAKEPPPQVKPKPRPRPHQRKLKSPNKPSKTPTKPRTKTHIKTKTKGKTKLTPKTKLRPTKRK